MKYKVQYHYYDEDRNFLKCTKEIVAEGYQQWPNGKVLFYGKDNRYFESFEPGFWDWIEEVELDSMSDELSGNIIQLTGNSGELDKKVNDANL